LRKASKWFKNRGIVVNCIYDSTGSGTAADFDTISKGQGQGVIARLFTSNRTRQWDGFTEDVLRSEGFKGDVDRLLASHGSVTSIEGITKEQGQETKKEILVCTHGSRDCRCSDLGGALVKSLRSEISKRNLDVQVREIAHVGGHK